MPQQTSKVLVTNRVVNAPLTSPAVRLNNPGGTDWTCVADMTVPVGNGMTWHVEQSADGNSGWQACFLDNFWVSNPLDKFGGDATHHVTTFVLTNPGNLTWFRAVVEQVTGSLTINSLTVYNQ